MPALKCHCHQITWDGPIYDFLVYAVAAVAAAEGMSQQMEVHMLKGVNWRPQLVHSNTTLQICRFVSLSSHVMVIAALPVLSHAGPSPVSAPAQPLARGHDLLEEKGFTDIASEGPNHVASWVYCSLTWRPTIDQW
jgi:hypothetical protein